MSFSRGYDVKPKARPVEMLPDSGISTTTRNAGNHYEKSLKSIYCSCCIIMAPVMMMTGAMAACGT